MLFFDVATSFDSAVHRVHAVSFDTAVLDVASTVSAGYIVSASICDAAVSFVLAKLGINGVKTKFRGGLLGIIEKDQVSFLLLEMFVSADGINWFLLIMNYTYILELSYEDRNEIY
ncbi:hypothetical protein Tco_0234522 [Tanacetum coccineum]